MPRNRTAGAGRVWLPRPSAMGSHAASTGRVGECVVRDAAPPGSRPAGAGAGAGARRGAHRVQVRGAAGPPVVLCGLGLVGVPRAVAAGAELDVAAWVGGARARSTTNVTTEPPSPRDWPHRLSPRCEGTDTATRSPTAKLRAPVVDAHPSSILSATPAATSSNAASTDSNSSADSPPATPNASPTTAERSSSPPSCCGCVPTYRTRPSSHSAGGNQRRLPGPRRSAPEDGRVGTAAVSSRWGRCRWRACCPAAR